VKVAVVSKRPFVIEHLRKAQMIELLAQGRRLDGRSLLDYRPIDIKCNVIQKANGSALVSLGNTQVIAWGED
jgi:exosome complex component RRP42